MSVELISVLIAIVAAVVALAGELTASMSNLRPDRAR